MYTTDIPARPNEISLRGKEIQKGIKARLREASFNISGGVSGPIGQSFEGGSSKCLLLSLPLPPPSDVDQSATGLQKVDPPIEGRDCRVVRDPQTFKSKGYGFVSFVKKATEQQIHFMSCVIGAFTNHITSPSAVGSDNPATAILLLLWNRISKGTKLFPY
ncbi:unnamed protein product [Nezara viridula]|uniref:RRM domain-containing protein n=1 Tax=Nezara viridula TaxID=85310 RepID=A0A9P0E634_NEZVI|nr:unnamed protein product [Nezara viridula]